MKKWVLFDVMGVIFTVGDDTNDLLVPFIQERNKSITRKEIQEAYMDASLGKITSNEFWKKSGICKSGDEQVNCKKYLDSCLTLDESFIPIAQRLKKNFNLGILSNDVSEWSAYLRVKYGIENVVDFSTISGDVKCRKPDMEIYRIAIKQTKVNASDCVFIDDRDKNLVPAMNQDMKVIRFLRNDDNTDLHGVAVMKRFLELEHLLKDIW